MAVEWSGLSTTTPRDFTCGYCGREVSSNFCYAGKWQGPSGVGRVWILVCSRCNFPTFFGPDGLVMPAERFGEKVEHLPDEVARLYNQARSVITVGGYTAAVLIGRKLLMHVAVERGAQLNQTFANYVDFLANEGIVTADMKPWVDEIRELGNDANHELVIMSREQAEELLTFVAMLLKIVYEYPEKGRQSVAKRGGTP
jgi:hypothetical protein